jgi:hypothetical protein
MKESHIEGVAIHDDPESCAGSRKAGREVLTGGTHRFGIEPRNQVIQGADAVKRSGRQHTRGVIASLAKPPDLHRLVTDSLKGK